MSQTAGEPTTEQPSVYISACGRGIRKYKSDIFWSCIGKGRDPRKGEIPGVGGNQTSDNFWFDRSTLSDPQVQADLSLEYLDSIGLSSDNNSDTTTVAEQRRQQRRQRGVPRIAARRGIPGQFRAPPPPGLDLFADSSESDEEEVEAEEDPEYQEGSVSGLESVESEEEIALADLGRPRQRRRLN